MVNKPTRIGGTCGRKKKKGAPVGIRLGFFPLFYTCCESGMNDGTVDESGTMTARDDGLEVATRARTSNVEVRSRKCERKASINGRLRIGM